MNTNEIKSVFFMAGVLFFMTFTQLHNRKLHKKEVNRIEALDSFYQVKPIDK